MPTIAVQMSDMQALIGRELDIARFEELLRLAKAELKEHNAATGEARIELCDTNRPDLWCAEGIARQIRAHLGGGVPVYPFFGTKAAPTQRIEVEPALATIRPYVVGFVARGPAVTGAFLVQMIQTQEMLCENYGRKRRNVAIGIYNAAKIRFPVRYRAMNPDEFSFVPLGADSPMTLRRILAEHAKGKEYAHLVKDLPACPVLTDSADKVLSFPPIINSRETGEVLVGDNHLFVEATGLDPAQILLAINIMACSFADRGWTIEPVLTVLPYDSALGRGIVAPSSMDVTVAIDPKEFSRSLGVDCAEAQIVEGLRAYGVEARQKGGTLVAVCPPYRDDYLHRVDVIEDYAISRGYGSFAPIMPSTFTVGKLRPLVLFADRVREQMIGFGFEEVFSNILSNRGAERESMRIPDEPIVAIENVMSETYSVVRSSIVPSLLRVEARSSKALYPHRIFEAGEVGVVDPGEGYGVRTEQRMAALWAAAEAGFSPMHSVLDVLLYYLGKEYALRPVDFPFYFQGRSAEIVAKGVVVGHMGELHPDVLTNFAITMPCTAFEIALDRV